MSMREGSTTETRSKHEHEVQIAFDFVAGPKMLHVLNVPSPGGDGIDPDRRSDRGNGAEKLRVRPEVK
jgi:hypothetical protein